MINFITNKIAQSHTTGVQNPNQKGRINTATKPYANDTFTRSTQAEHKAQPKFGASLKVNDHESFFLKKIEKITKVINEKLEDMPVEEEFQDLSEEIMGQKHELAGHFTDLAKTYLDLDSNSVLCRQNAFHSAINAVHYSPEHPEANFICGTLEGEPKDAFKFLTTALQGDPKNPDYLTSRAITAQEIGDKKTAISDMQKLITIEPKEPEHRIQKGFVHLAFKDHNAAVAEFDKAIEIAPQNYRGHAGKAYTLFEMGKFPEAAKSYEKAIQLNPPADELGVMRSNMGSSYYQIKNYPKAIESYTLALETASDPMIFLDRGLSHFYSGNYEHAISDAKMSQKTGAGDLSTVSLQVASLRKLERHDEAENLLALAEDSYPELDFRTEVDDITHREGGYQLQSEGEKSD